MKRRQLGQLNKLDVQEGVGRNEESIWPFVLNVLEGNIDLTPGIGVEHLDLQAHGARFEFILAVLFVELTPGPNMTYLAALALAGGELLV
jgi:hypothetical protein